MKIVQRNKSNPNIPTASMADVAFLLIVFFMLTTVIAITRGLDFKVPEEAPPDEQQQQKNPAIYLYISETGVLLMDKKPAQLSQVRPYIKEKLLVNPNKPIIIHCSLDAQYQKMIDVLDEVKQVEEDLYGVYNAKQQFEKDKKRIKITIPSAEEAELYNI